MIKKIGFTLVLFMALLQGFYALFAFLDPMSFATVRGTTLYSTDDLDWVQIYASRTLFISLTIGVLLYLRNYKTLLFAAIIGTVMPITDGWLAYQAGADTSVVAKHVATIVYLLITSLVLLNIVKKESVEQV
ncbi:DUF4267 domain-containing protein [Aliikangiella coralliicola]|uniref:DUF4267 domain-containing protein n=1 Tax=Aliikangiella coralliicola TaxID=2592383 RepID=A0A545TWC3_9GAMM|nr:DUF4267 domain-containing protein [Aliikangiella coralliicola]TQV81502.1 DUF4267 domain-containing protein [Aliikangiella coralliicola]